MTRQNFSDHIDSDAKVEQPDAVFDNASTIEVEFEYPLAKPARVIFKAANGFSRQTFFNEVRETYRHIYKQEALTTTIAPSRLAGMGNRNTTDGRYGIWGHVLGDLYLEGAQKRDGVWHLEIGS